MPNINKKIKKIKKSQIAPIKNSDMEVCVDNNEINNKKCFINTFDNNYFLLVISSILIFIILSCFVTYKFVCLKNCSLTN